ncbi:MAG: hypothetical protein M1830_010014 [Pleopsidium flavum]|nr:MAG: hypothetical protein M1830_010014 [Pleopsidium flavum]
MAPEKILREDFLTLKKVEHEISACAMLESLFPTSVFSPGSAAYTAESQAIWSQAAWLWPSCVFVPSSPKELARGLKTLAHTKTPFAIRSGGNMPVKGHASIDGGVLIAMSRLNEMTLVPTPNDFDVPYLRAGSAHTWKEIYEHLDPHDLFVIGGRVVSVGTSLILGGGISYFSGTHGWAANNVINFEVVLANGTIVNANKSTNMDLFWALKGGSNNFGIVTRYDMVTHEGGLMWGGAVAWDPVNTPAFLDAQTKFMLPGGGSDDPKAALMSNIEVNAGGAVSSGAMLLYHGDVADPPVFGDFLKITPMFTTLGVHKFATLVAPTSIYGARDKRSLFSSTSLKIDPLTMKIVHDEVVSTAKTMLGNVDCSVGAGVQPVTHNFLQAAKDLGGDPMDLDPEKGSFCVVLLYAYWFQAEDDTLLNAWAEATVNAIERRTKQTGLYYPFTFLNDAGGNQKPLETYGYGKSLPRLRELSKKYDPDGVFQTLVSGFKLGMEF